MSLLRRLSPGGGFICYTLTVGQYISGGFPVYIYYGYGGPPYVGSSFGSSTAASGGFFGYLYYNSTVGSLVYAVSANDSPYIPNFDSVKISGAIFVVADATYNVYTSGSPMTSIVFNSTWTWSGVSNPFGTVGAVIPVCFKPNEYYGL